MINKIISIGFILLLIFTGGCSKNITLSDLRQKRISFSNLPLPVQNIYGIGLVSEENYTLSVNTNNSFISLICLDVDSEYKIESIKTKIGPWISHTELTDVSKGITYEMKRESPDPAIIFENKLYIPMEYNILMRRNKIEELKKIDFIEYELK